MLSTASSPFASRIGGRLLAAALVAISLIGGLLVLEAPQVASAEHPECEVTDLGTLGGETQELEATGRWTTEDCDSEFRAGSDAHRYRFEVTEPGRIRIGLTSADADSYLYLLAEDGTRIADNDDGGGLLGARVERDLEAAAYLVEATTVGGRSRGPADFSLSIGYVSGCEPVHLGALEPGGSLTASGVWTIDTCGSRFVASHPAYTYAFNLPEAGRVRIDLNSEDGDPVLSLISPAQGVIGANDDGGPGVNSRLDQYLASGPYLIEATTYSARDRNRVLADFTLTVSYIESDTFLIKVEALEIPDVVIAGEPFTVDYRVGNLGHTDLPEGLSVVVVTAAPGRTWDITESVTAEGGHWGAGVSYHSGEEAATATSTALPALGPLHLNIREPGDSYVVLVTFTNNDETEEEVDFHFIERVLTVHSGPTYGPHTVRVDGTAYSVVAAADEEGLVTTSVISLSDPAADVEDATQAKAIYAAAVREYLLDGLFERPGLAGLAAAEEAAEVSVENASSSTLLRLFAEQYLEAIALFGLDDVLASGEVINPLDVQALVLHVADKAARQYAALSASWSALQEGVEGGAGLAFNDAFALQAGLAYAERLLAPIAAAGSIAAQAGPGDMAPGDEYDALARQASCGVASLGDAFAAAGVEDIDALLALDGELRANLPVFGLGSDAALCAIAGVDAANAAFLARLGIAEPGLVALNAPDPGPEPVVEEAPEPAPHRLRIIASLREDGRVEHGVEIDGTYVLPPDRLLPADARAGAWYASGDVEIDGAVIGTIRARRLADGRIELGFRDTYGEAIEPDVRFVADPPAGIFVRSSVIEVTPPAAVSEDEGASE